MRTDLRRLRKYARKKAMAPRAGNPRLAGYLALYWRYWHRAYGDHKCLWALD